LKERDLREPVADWFREHGYECAYERFFASGYCDVLAFRFAKQTSRRIPDLLEAIAVELKLKDVGTAIWQARGYARGGAKAFVAMPLERCRRMRGHTLDEFRRGYIGLLAIELLRQKGDQVHLWMGADYMPKTNGIQWMKKKLWRTHKKAAKNKEVLCCGQQTDYVF